VLLGDGKGGFTPAGLAPSGFNGDLLSSSFNMGLTDLNGDGKLDLWQVFPGTINLSNPSQCQTTHTIFTVWLGDGKGGFGAASDYTLDPADSVASAYGDFNGDGKPDFAVYTYNTDGSNCGVEGPTLTILLNNGNGTFAQSGTSNAAVLLTQRPATPLGPQPASAAGGSTRVGFRGMVAGDFDGDGKTDLVLAYNFQSQPGNLHLLYGDGKGGFRDGYNYTVDSLIQTMAAASENGDRKMDLVLGLTARNAPGALPRIATLLAKQTTGFYWASSTALPNPGVNLNYPAINALADFNGDGKLDVMLTNQTFPTNNTYSIPVLVLAGEGDGIFAAPKSFPAGSSSNNLTAPDCIAPFKAGGLPNVFLTNVLTTSSGTFLYYLENQSK
jgi:FG-GAP-like repeat